MIEALALAATLMAQSEPLSPAARNDLQCFMATTVVVGIMTEDANVDRDAVAGVVSGVTYFYGRLEGRDPDVNWLAYIEAHPELADAAVADPVTFQRCAAQMQAMGSAMSAFSQRGSQQ